MQPIGSEQPIEVRPSLYLRCVAASLVATVATPPTQFTVRAGYDAEDSRSATMPSAHDGQKPWVNSA